MPPRTERSAVSERTCDLCAGELARVYRVPESKRGITVAVCQRCGLIQSELGTDYQASRNPHSVAYAGPRDISPSSGPGWGNIRHGKGLRLQRQGELLAAVPWASVQRVLDVGSNRGDFLRWLHQHHPDKKVKAVEPDPMVTDYGSQVLAWVDFENCHLERAHLDAGGYDFVYCSHSLEHADSARQMLDLIHGAMRDGAPMLLDLPNAEGLRDPDNIEEFFVDKHNFHFTPDVLVEYLAHAGFAVTADRTDQHNFSYLVRKTVPRAAGPYRPNAPQRAQRNAALVSAYVERLQSNRARLGKVVERINFLTSRQRVAIWGGGRLLDALVRYGGLEPHRIACVVDEHLHRYLKKIHGMPLTDAQALRSLQPQSVLVLARSSAGEIEAKVRNFGIRNVIRFQDLLASQPGGSTRAASQSLPS